MGRVVLKCYEEDSEERVRVEAGELHTASADTQGTTLDWMLSQS